MDSAPTRILVKRDEYRRPRPRSLRHVDASTPEGRYSLELAAWLDDFGWDIFFTFTHARGDLSLPAWRRAMRRFYDSVGPARLYWATERGKLGRSHVHGLMGGRKHKWAPPITVDHVFKYGTKTFGRTAAGIYDPGRGAAAYCSKYVTKDAHDYDFYGR